ncbi:MAG: hypothetical protein EPN23_05720 [Verrucomicrobia bacterium]|nr:MAG: hypothetical protein EPN23_05720 [Verrucomicrobiota bacterium]
MVYDPVTREFRPQEALGVKPPAGQGLAAAPISAGAVFHRSRRRQGVLRRREILFWFLMMIVVTALVWSTLLIAKELGSRFTAPEKSIIDRVWRMLD